MNFIEELRWRGMLHDYTPGVEEFLNQNKPVAGYIGFDPTAASLHVGNLATIMLLVHFQRCGHKPYVLVGGATGMIGDPSGKSAERQFLDQATLLQNQVAIAAQLRRFLDFENGANKAEMLNNYDWFKNIGFLQFLREAGKYITVNYMMAKESVKKRLETGISFTEFSYQLLQGYDFYYLYKTIGMRLQMGGADQWGNITTGTELIRRKLAHERGLTDISKEQAQEAFALTAPLLTKADGSKFGKSEGGNIWLDPTLTSPYKFYQFWLNTADEDAPRLIRVFTLLDRATIEKLEAEHAAAPHLRILQKAIAEEVTVRVHGRTAYEKAVQASAILFGNATTEALNSIDEDTLLSVFEGVTQVQVPAESLQSNIVDFLSVVTRNEIFSSKSEARKMIQGGGVSINKIKIHENMQLSEFQLLQNRYLLVQKGKKNYYLVRVSA
ncbi:MAG: tyrosine--tRNA ligase [Cytophagales bacterium]|nr:tyrosine--tRNA ligase [Bernardetiaceae bacterium]MDW8203391.1 tyrosine--tRNA ligase [Cytophagales bacterium]